MNTTFDLSLVLHRYSKEGLFLAFLLTGSSLQHMLPSGSWKGETYNNDKHSLLIKETTLEDMKDFAQALREKFAHYHRFQNVEAFANAVLAAAERETALTHSTAERQALEPMSEAA